MKIRRFYGKDMREALKQVKAELGGDAVIMSNKKVANGVELVAAYDNEPVAKEKIDVPLTQRAEYPNGKKVPTLSEIIGDSGPDSLKALLEKQVANASGNKQQLKIEPRIDAISSAMPPAMPRVQPHSEQQGINEIRQELASLRNVLQFQVSGLLQQQKQRNHPLHGYLITRLEQMGIQSELAEEVVSYAPDDIDERQAWLFLLRLLANRLSISGNDILSQSGVVALLGPTGTGKTTTIAKLAAQYALKYGPEQVALITIDSYRIAAYEQLATYGKIIGCSVKKAQSAEELSDQLYQLRHKRLILIDTAGFGQRDARLIKQLDTLNGNSCDTIKKYLIMQANSQYQVMDYTIRAYKQISLQGCIFTKLDECYSLGEAISAAIVHRLPVSYVTDGQKVPEDMKVADAKYLITTAAKLYKKYGLSHNIAQRVVHSAAAV
jgi:flagellar biosynthesis protein FlhF